MKASNLIALAIVFIFCIAQLAYSENYALLFNGKDGHVLCETNNLPVGNAPRTEEAWVKTESPDGYLHVVGYGTAGTNNSALALFTKGGSIVITQWGASIAVPVGLNDGEWHHIAVTHDGNNKQTVYYEGKAVGNWNQTLNTVVGTFTIGCCLNEKEQFFNGQIDEVRLWDAERTEAEISNTMYVSLTGNEEHLIGCWNFNEGKGDTANDSSANKNHGKLIGGVEWTKSDTPVKLASVDLNGKITSLWGRIKTAQ